MKQVRQNILSLLDTSCAITIVCQPMHYDFSVIDPVMNFVAYLRSNQQPLSPVVASLWHTCYSLLRQRHPRDENGAREGPAQKNRMKAGRKGGRHRVAQGLKLLNPLYLPSQA